MSSNNYVDAEVLDAEIARTEALLQEARRECAKANVRAFGIEDALSGLKKRRKELGAPANKPVSAGEFALTASTAPKSFREGIRNFVSGFPNGVAPRDVKDALIKQGFKAAETPNRVSNELFRLKQKGHVSNQNGLWFIARRQ